MQIGYLNTAIPEEYLSGRLLYGVGRSEDALEPGQIVEAEVIFASREAANVRLSNGAVMRARLEGGAALTEGETVFLAVKESHGNSLVLQLITDPAALADPKTPTELLGQVGLRNTPVNQLLASALAESRLPVEAALIQRAGEILEKFPDASVKAAVFAAANDIEATPQNLGAIDALLRSDFKASDMLVRIFSLLGGEGAQKTPGQPQAAARPADAGLSQVPADSGRTPGASGRAGIPGGTVPAGAETMEEGAAAAGAAGEEIQNGPENPGVLINKEGGAAKNTQPAAADGENGEPQAMPGQSERGRPANAGAGPVLTVDGQKSPRTAETSFFARIEKPEDAAALKTAGEQLLGRLARLRTDIDTRTGGGKSAAGEADRLIGGLRLMEAVDRYAYMQIPVMTGGRPSTVEMYVFNKKKSAKKTNPDATTVLLALDTDNLGHVEALVTIRKTGVSIRFNLEDETVAAYFRDRTVALYNMISAAGLHLTGVQYQTGGQPVTPLTALRAAEEPGDGADRKINVRVQRDSKECQMNRSKTAHEAFSGNAEKRPADELPTQGGNDFPAELYGILTQIMLYVGTIDNDYKREKERDR